MSDFETELSDSFPSFEEKTSHFSQTGSISDPSLNQLRDQIKKVMIPLLIKTFQFKLELNQSLSLPSRIQSKKNQRSPEEILNHLKTLDNDLKILLLWCQSCRSQVQKAFKVLEEEEQKSPIAASSTTANPSITKSFQEAVSIQPSFFQQQSQEENHKLTIPKNSPTLDKKKWWNKFWK